MLLGPVHNIAGLAIERPIERKNDGFSDFRQLEGDIITRKLPFGAYSRATLILPDEPRGVEWLVVDPPAPT